MFKHFGKDSGLFFASADLRDITVWCLATMRAEIDLLDPIHGDIKADSSGSTSYTN